MNINCPLWRGRSKKYALPPCPEPAIEPAPLFHEFVVEAEIEVGSSNCTDDRGRGRMFRTAGEENTGRRRVEDERKCHTRKVETTGLP